MKQNNIINRFFRSISDFSFSNQFMPEKLSKAWWFVFQTYLIFLVIMLGSFLVSFQPKIEEDIQALDDTIRMMPDFQIDSEGFSFVDGLNSGAYESSRWKIIVDFESEKPSQIKVDDERHHLFINKNALYYEKDIIIDFNILPSLITKAQVIQSVDELENIIYLGLFIACIFGVFILFLITLGIWLLMIIIQGFVKKDIPSKDCYKIGLYAMTLPNVVLTFIWVTGFYVPGFVWLYIGLASYYGYSFMKHYQPKNIDLSHIYE